MYTVDYAIDTIQGMKKQFATNFVSNELLRDTMLNMISAETAYAKQMVKSTEEVIALAKDQFNYFPTKK
jgi:hypothetical protein